LTIWYYQFRSLVSWILVGAALVSMLLGETVDGIAIVAIVLLNAS
jgi:Ca2+-transporting ATPase